MSNRIASTVATLKSKSKKDVFNIWASKLGRIHCADIREQRKGWMIYDIIAAEFGKDNAEAYA